MYTVLLTGGNGLIGRHLCKKLQDKGYRVTVLSRTVQEIPNVTTYTWDWKKGDIEREAIDTADYVIHLAGENIGGGRWTSKRKKEIVDSRVRTAQLLYREIKSSNKTIKGIISASAVGYYGALTTDNIYNEADHASQDFLGETCRLWEESADEFIKLGIRTVKIRTGVVLTRKGGALSKMKLPVKMGLGSAVGTGKQFMPWIHIDDLCDIYIKALKDTRMQGAYNAVAPDHATNAEFTRTLAQVMNKSLWLPNVPAAVLKFFFGEMSDILLKGSRVSAERVVTAGYHFNFPDLSDALKDLINRKVN